MQSNLIYQKTQGQWERTGQSDCGSQISHLSGPPASSSPALTEGGPGPDPCVGTRSPEEQSEPEWRTFWHRTHPAVGGGTQPERSQASIVFNIYT